MVTNKLEGTVLAGVLSLALAFPITFSYHAKSASEFAQGKHDKLKQQNPVSVEHVHPRDGVPAGSYWVYRFNTDDDPEVDKIVRLYCRTAARAGFSCLENVYEENDLLTSQVVAEYNDQKLRLP